MADFPLIVGVNVGASVTEFNAGIAEVASKINPVKIKVEVDKTSISQLQSQLKSITIPAASVGASGAGAEAASMRNLASATNEAATAARNLNSAKNEGKASDAASNASIKERISALTAYTNAITTAEKRLRDWSAAENSKNDTSRAAYQELQSNISALKSLEAQYQSGVINTSQFREAIAQLNLKVKEVGLTLQQTGDNTKSFAERFGKLAGKFSSWLTVSQLIMYSIRTVRKMISESIELDSAMTQMQIVTKASSAEMEAFGNAAAQSAQRTASSIKDIVDSATTFARLGYSMDESKTLAEYTAMLQNVGNIDVTSAQSAITSIIKAFDIDTSQIESVMDKLVVVGNNFPISVSEIAEGMTNASSTLQAAGNSFEQTVALLTAANVTIQNAAKSSTGLRTITARIRNTTAELDELGEVMTEAKYEELVGSITKAGVSITDMNGEFRSTYDILADLSAIWSELDSKEQSAIATALAGTRMQAVFYSIVNNFEEASGAMDAMKDSAGELDSSFDIYLDSIQAHINQFKAAFQELSSDVFKNGVVNFFVDIGTAIIKFIDIVARLSGVFTIIDKLYTWVSHIGNSEKQLANLRQEFTKITESIQSTSDDFNSLNSSFESVVPRLVELSRGVDELGGNVSLTSEDYAEFVELNNKIAEMFPQLVTGYDENGNAMLSLSYSAETLTDSLNDLLEAERELSQQKMADDLDDIFENVNKQHKLYDSELESAYDEISNLQLAYESFKEAVGDSNTYDYRFVGAIANSLYEAIGYTGARFIDDTMMTFDTAEVERAYENTMAGLWKKFDSINNKIAANDKKVNPYIQAWLSTDYNYGELTDSMQTLAKNILSGLNFRELGLSTVDEVKEYISDNIINTIQNMAPEAQDALSKLLTINTAGKSASEYIQEVNDAAISIAESIGYTWNPTEILEFTLHDKTIAQIESTAKEIATILAGGFEGEFQSIYDEMLSMPVDELYRAITLVKKYGITSIAELRKSLAEKTFDVAFDFSKESESFTKLNTALNESASATGLTADSVAELTKRYSELEGFKPEALFEHTANGIHLNQEALESLETQYNNLKKLQAQRKLAELQKKLAEVNKEIEAAGDNTEKLNELNQRKTGLESDISDAKNLISYYNGMTSAYNRWLQAKSRTDERAGYESIGDEYKNVKQLIDRGWVDATGVDEYLDLLLGADRATKDNVAAFEQLTKKIEGTDYSLMDFFKYDKDGNSVTDGLYDFLDAVHQLLGDDFVTMGKDGFATAFDFSGDKLQQVADALGTSVEMVQLMERALQSAGFDVEFDSMAEGEKKAGDKAGEAKDEVAELEKEIEKAKQLAEDWKNTDLTATLKVDADEAQTTFDTLNDKKDTWTAAPAILQATVSAEDSETDAGAAFKLLQDFLNAYGALKVALALGEDGATEQAKVDALLAEMSKNAIITAGLGINTESQDAAIKSIEAITPRMLVDVGLSEETVKSVTEYKPDNKLADVIFSPVHWKVDNYIDSVKDLHKTIWYTYKTNNNPPSGSSSTNSSSPYDGVNYGFGADADGTAFSRGYWGSPDNGWALGGELGQELVVRDGHFFTIGDKAAEFFQYKKGDIIFNADQTEEIFRYGRIRSGRKRGSAMAWGTAFDRGKGGYSGKYGSGTSVYLLDGGKSGSGTGSGGGKSKTDGKEDNWFIKQYKLNNHLINMCQEEMSDYLEWLAWALPKAYDEGIVELDDYRKYQEELFSKLQDSFKDYLSDVEHEIDMRSQFEGETNNILSLYKQLMGDIEKEIAAARAQGLTDNDDYIQNLQSKWVDYADAVKDIEDEALENAKDATDKLIDYRQKMLKQEISDEKDGLKKKLDNLKDFYDKQKEMLKDARDEEKYLDEQAEKRQSVTDIQAQLAQLEYDNSAWAQKRKAELRKQLADAQKELTDFEKDHALDETLNFLDKSYEAQEEQINAEMEQLDNLLNDPEALYNRALADISGDTSKLYEEMLEYNRRHGTGNDADVESEYGEAYAALLRYHDLNGEWYGGVQLPNATGYTTPSGSWNTETISGYANPTTVQKQTPDRTYGMTSSSDKSTKKKSTTISGVDKDRLDAARAADTKEFPEIVKPAAVPDKFKVVLSDAKPGKLDRWVLQKAASGTSNAKRGLSMVDELGPEWLFTSSSGNKYRIFSGGEKVLNAKATEFLYNFANNGGEVLSRFFQNLVSGGAIGSTQPSAVNVEVNMGDIVVQGSANQATVSEIRRAQRESVNMMLREFNRLNK